MSLPYEGSYIGLAKGLRKGATKQEKHLWYDFLRDYSPHFQRQKVIGQYIADFYCHRAGLVIELDGGQHYMVHGMQQDEMRTDTLEEYGVQVLRFSNQDVNRNFTGVCKVIDYAVKERMKSGNQKVQLPFMEE